MHLSWFFRLKPVVGWFLERRKIRKPYIVIPTIVHCSVAMSLITSGRKLARIKKLEHREARQMPETIRKER